jgi:predicted nucleic acid-binding Zn ribbon protein
MPRRTTYDEPDDDEWEDDFQNPDDIEYDPDEDEAGAEFASGDSPEVPCPHCGTTITEDHLRCPRCENYITKEDAPPVPKSPFVMIMLVVSLVAVLMFWVLR